MIEIHYPNLYMIALKMESHHNSLHTIHGSFHPKIFVVLHQNTNPLAAKQDAYSSRMITRMKY
jgi:hypothetical protein